MSADRLRPLAALVLLSTLLASGCSDAFDPFIEADQNFALFGFLDARRDTQFVRVQPITGQDMVVVAARVTSMALASGEQVVWQDSLVQLDDATLGTLYYAAFRPEPGTTYRVEAASQGTAGVPSTAEVVIPAEPPLRVDAPVVGESSVTEVLRLESVLRPRAVRATYTVQRVGGEPIGFSFNYTFRSASGGFEVIVALLRDASTIRSILGIDPDGPERPALLDLRLDYDLVDESQPTANGLGSFGAAAHFTTGWTLAPEVAEVIGFVDAQGGE